MVRRGRPKGRPACGNPVCWRPIIRGCVIHRIRGGLPTWEPLQLRSLGPRRPADCELRPALSTGFAAGSPRGSPYDCGPWDRGGLRTATGDLRYPQDSRRAPHVGAPTIAVLGTAATCGLRPATCVIHRIQAGRLLGVPYDAVRGTAADCDLRYSQDSRRAPHAGAPTVTMPD